MNETPTKKIHSITESKLLNFCMFFQKFTRIDISNNKSNFDMKIINSSVRVIEIFLILLIIITSIVTPISFLESEKTIIKNDNQKDKIYQKYEIIFNEKLLENSHFDSVLMGILTASAAIVAVAFAITQIIISNISQKYSPKILEIYFQKSSPYRSFMALILTTSGTVTLLIFYNIIIPQLVVIFTIIIVDGFLISLWLFTINFKMVFHIISPYYFMDDIKEMVLENMTED